MYQRNFFHKIFNRLEEGKRFIQVLIGPRQVGKSTLAQQILTAWPGETHHASADMPGLSAKTWIEAQWQVARQKLQTSPSVLLVLDEVQKIADWSNVIKALWDQDSLAGNNIKVLLLGSTPLLIHKGLTESLAGRFEQTLVPHWSFNEMHQAFGLNLEQYIYFGGYPGAAQLIQDQERWRSYINDSLIETTISRDVLLLNQVNKPALMRQLFGLGCQYSSQILSYNKMLGQLDDAGNTTTLAHYLKLLDQASILGGIAKHTHSTVKTRASSPKLQVYNTALLSAQSHFSFESLLAEPTAWGRWVESAVGAALMNFAKTHHATLHYWRENNQEVDYVLTYKGKVCALEIKSTQKPSLSSKGLNTFVDKYKPNNHWIVGSDAMPLATFFSQDIDNLFC